MLYRLTVVRDSIVRGDCALAHIMLHGSRSGITERKIVLGPIRMVNYTYRTTRRCIRINHHNTEQDQYIITANTNHNRNRQHGSFQSRSVPLPLSGHPRL